MSLTLARHAGLLVPLFSMPSSKSWGIGEIGDVPLVAAWLRDAHQDLLQLLPINEMAIGQRSPARVAPEQFQRRKSLSPKEGRNPLPVAVTAPLQVAGVEGGSEPGVVLLGGKTIPELEADLRLCPKCSRPLPKDTNICAACLNRGKTLLRLFEFTKPYRFRLAWGTFLILSGTLLDLLRQVAPDESLPDDAAKGPSRIMEGGIDIHDFMERNESFMKTTAGYLDIAMMVESQALDLYLRFADRMRLEATREVLLAIAQEEHGHLVHLGRLYDEIS